MIKPYLFALVLLGLGVAAMADETGPAQASKAALEQFSGTWEIVAVQPPGMTKDAKTLIFRVDQTYAALDADGNELWAGTFDLDPTVVPKVWDHRAHESRKHGGDALGIYELNGDTLKACCVVGTWNDGQWTGKPRPAEFTIPAADVVLNLRRVQAGK